MLALDRARTALLLMDFQNGIVAMFGAEGAQCAERAAQARQAARKAGIAVMHIRVALTAEEAAAVPAQNRIFAAAAASGRLADHDAATQLITQLASAPDEEVFRKRRVGAFSTTQLGARLATRAIHTLVLSGLATSGVVLSTLRDGADRDLRMLVLSDCCADPDPDVHRVLMDKVFPRQAEVISLAEFVSACAS
ncbi:MAG: cysteine hydrolase [Alphaproteobacteria bacterium]|nr:cysteine hydrolase [Alphaproteobacteria bacterium]